MIAVLAVLVLAAIILGGRPLGAWLRKASLSWRPAAGLGSVMAFAAALALAVREAWLAALILALAGVALALGARRRARPPVDPRREMDAEAARAILGVGPAARPDEVQAAYLRLMRMAHPDRGGTRGLAAQLNAAREALIGRRR